MLKVVGIIVLVAIVAFIGFAFFSLNCVYSSGERAGYVQKFSKRGWLCKTWEGEMAMVTHARHGGGEVRVHGAR